MPKSKDQKKQILKSLNDKIDKSKSIFFTKFNKLTVKENEQLRKSLKDENSEYIVAKKTLLDLAFKNKNISGLDIKKFEGQLSLILGYKDEIAPAKIADNFISKNEKKVEFIGGIMENKFLTSNEVITLSKLPSKQELYSSLVSSLNAPISGFVNSLAGVIKNLLYSLKAIEDKKAN